MRPMSRAFSIYLPELFGLTSVIKAVSLTTNLHNGGNMLDPNFEQEIGYDESEELYEEQDTNFDDLRDIPIDTVSRDMFTDY